MELGSRYMLERLIGHGATGAVWQGHSRDGQEFAFKLLRPELLTDPGLVSRFFAERTVLTGVEHPNLVRVHDLVVEGERFAIVMDLIAGGDLRKYLRERGGTLAAAEALELTQQVLAAAAALHKAGLVHGDLKPENVLLEFRSPEDTVPRITDYGTARLVEEAAASRTSSIIGTPHYLAPELAEGGAVSVAADIYAIGIMLYELVCGVTPFAGGHPVVVLRRHIEDPPGRPEGLNDGLWFLMSSLLAKAPADRPSASEAADQCGQLAVNLIGADRLPFLTSPPLRGATMLKIRPGATEVPPEVKPLERPRRVVAVAVGAVVLALTVAIGAVAAGRGGSDLGPLRVAPTRPGSSDPASASTPSESLAPTPSESRHSSTPKSDNRAATSAPKPHKPKAAATSTTRVPSGKASDTPSDEPEVEPESSASASNTPYEEPEPSADSSDTPAEKPVPSPEPSGSPSASAPVEQGALSVPRTDPSRSASERSEGSTAGP